MILALYIFFPESMGAVFGKLNDSTHYSFWLCTPLLIIAVRLIVWWNRNETTRKIKER